MGFGIGVGGNRKRDIHPSGRGQNWSGLLWEWQMALFICNVSCIATRIGYDSLIGSRIYPQMTIYIYCMFVHMYILLLLGSLNSYVPGPIQCSGLPPPLPHLEWIMFHPGPQYLSP